MRPQFFAQVEKARPKPVDVGKSELVDAEVTLTDARPWLSALELV